MPHFYEIMKYHYDTDLQVRKWGLPPPKKRGALPTFPKFMDNRSRTWKLGPAIVHLSV